MGGRGRSLSCISLRSPDGKRAPSSRLALTPVWIANGRRGEAKRAVFK